MVDVFAQKIRDEIINRSFKGFDSVIIELMGFNVQNDLDVVIRKQALKEFQSRSDQYAFASRPTMRRWFGLGGTSKPSREQVYEIGLVLKLSVNSVEKLLTKGLGEPSFQVNDYQEMIFLYGLEHQLSYMTCISMIHVFEDNLDENTSLQKTHTTIELRNQYKHSNHLNQQEFLLWMADRAEWFRGYSKTALDFLKQYRSAILINLREAARKRLDLLLGETDFNKWCSRFSNRNLVKEDQYTIEKYIRSLKDSKQCKVSVDLLNNLIELEKLAYDEKQTNIVILAEVFARNEYLMPGNYQGNIRSMSGKYISDLFNVPTHKEQDIRITKALRVLNGMPDSKDCPSWIKQIGEEYTHGKGQFDTVNAAKESLEKYYREHKRRCLLIQRGDLLPLILHVAQQQYIDKHDVYYDENEAKQHFINLANATLNACNMATLSEEYELDCALLFCFQKDEMYSYSDVLDALYEKCEEALLTDESMID